MLTNVMVQRRQDKNTWIAKKAITSSHCAACKEEMSL